MAYRRRHGLSRASTFQEETRHYPSPESTLHPPSPQLFSSYSFSPSSSSSTSLAAQAIQASAARRDSSLSFLHGDSALASEHLRFQGTDAYGDDTGRGEPKSGFWGVLAHKAKSMLEEDISSPKHEMADGTRSHAFNGGQQSYQAPESLRKMENPTIRKGLDAITLSLNQLGDTFEKAFEEGRTIVESKTADLRTQIQRNGSNLEDRNQASGVRSAWKQPAPQNPTCRETQLKASRDVAMATAAKAKLLLRELKTVKADLAFAKARGAQLEEENKLLRDSEGREKGQNGADDDLIRLQLETLLGEKARLANENEIYSRENRFLREIVEYHQLTMQDVVYLDSGMEEVTEVYPIDTEGVTGMLSISPDLTPPATPPSPPITDPQPPQNKSVSVSEHHPAN